MEHLSFPFESSEMHGIVIPGRILDILTIMSLMIVTIYSSFYRYRAWHMAMGVIVVQTFNDGVK